MGSSLEGQLHVRVNCKYIFTILEGLQKIVEENPHLQRYKESFKLTNTNAAAA